MIIIVMIIRIMAVKMIHVCQNMQLVIMQVSMHPEMHDYVDLSFLPHSTSSLKDISVNRMKKKDATREAAKKETLVSVTNSLGHHHHAIQVNLKVI